MSDTSSTDTAAATANPFLDDDDDDDDSSYLASAPASGILSDAVSLDDAEPQGISNNGVEVDEVDVTQNIVEGDTEQELYSSMQNHRISTAPVENGTDVLVPPTIEQQCEASVEVVDNSAQPQCTFEHIDAVEEEASEMTASQSSVKEDRKMYDTDIFIICSLSCKGDVGYSRNPIGMESAAFFAAYNMYYTSMMLHGDTLRCISSRDVTTVWFRTYYFVVIVASRIGESQQQLQIKINYILSLLFMILGRQRLNWNYIVHPENNFILEYKLGRDRRILDALWDRMNVDVFHLFKALKTARMDGNKRIDLAKYLSKFCQSRNDFCKDGSSSSSVRRLKYAFIFIDDMLLTIVKRKPLRKLNCDEINNLILIATEAFKNPVGEDSIIPVYLSRYSDEQMHAEIAKEPKDRFMHEKHFIVTSHIGRATLVLLATVVNPVLEADIKFECNIREAGKRFRSYLTSRNMDLLNYMDNYTTASASVSMRTFHKLYLSSNHLFAELWHFILIDKAAARFILPTPPDHLQTRHVLTAYRRTYDLLKSSSSSGVEGGGRKVVTFQEFDETGVCVGWQLHEQAKEIYLIFSPFVNKTMLPRIIQEFMEILAANIDDFMPNVNEKFLHFN